MKQLILVFFGGGLGSALRYLLGKQLPTSHLQLPWSTFMVNLIGSLIIGSLFGYMATKHKLSNDIIVFTITGFCGGFTTFSAFTKESFYFLKNGQSHLFFYYVLGSIIFGLLCVWIGYITVLKTLGS